MKILITESQLKHIVHRNGGIYYHGTGHLTKVIDALNNGRFIPHKSAGVNRGIYISPSKELAIDYTNLTDGDDKGVVELEFIKAPRLKRYPNAREQYEDERSYSYNPKEAALKYHKDLLDNGYDGIQTGPNVIIVFYEKIGILKTI